MSSAEYYRSEAQRCHKLAQGSEDPEVVRRARALASDYNILADEIAGVPQLPPQIQKMQGR